MITASKGFLPSFEGGRGGGRNVPSVLREWGWVCRPDIRLVMNILWHRNEDIC